MKAYPPKDCHYQRVYTRRIYAEGYDKAVQEMSDTIDEITRRLRKLESRVFRDPVAGDQVRLSLNVLSRMRRPEQPDYEVIDIFDPALPAFPKHAIITHTQNENL